MTDIVIIHRNRLDYLKRTLRYLWKRTKTPYRISIIDNHSDIRNRRYLIDLFNNKKIFNLQLNGRNTGPCIATNQALTITTSQPFVLMPDDVLVPDVTPDWLHTLLVNYGQDDLVGMLVLNDPTNDKGELIRHEGEMTLVKSVDCNVGVINRKAYKFLPHKTKVIRKGIIMSENFWEVFKYVAYLAKTHCKHIGKTSAFKGLYENDKFPKKTFVKTDPKTLEPL